MIPLNKTFFCFDNSVFGGQHGRRAGPANRAGFQSDHQVVKAIGYRVGGGSTKVDLKAQS